MIIVLLFIVAPIAELYVIIKTGQAIGVLNTIGLLVLIGFIGSWVIRREGVKVWNRFTSQVQAGQVPTKEIADGVCILIAGALMLAPGFVSDVVALLLLFPPTRAVARNWLMRRKGLGRLGGLGGPGGGGFGGTTIIDASYGGRMRDSTDVTDTTSTETRGELDS